MSQAGITTTTPDDLFYILRIVLSRLLSTGSLKGLRDTLGLLRKAIEEDFINVIKKRLEDVYRTPSGMGPGGRGEKGDREGRSMFIVSHGATCQNAT